MFSQLKLGCPAHIYIANGKKQLELSSSLFDIVDPENKTLVLNAPTYKGGLIHLGRIESEFGVSEFDVIFQVKPGEWIRFVAKFNSYTEINNIKCVSIICIDEGKRFQRREAVRHSPILGDNIDVRFSAFRPKDEEDIENMPLEMLDGRALDISAGGLRLLSPIYLSEDNHLQFEIYLPGGRVLEDVQGKIIRKNSDNATKNKYIYGIEFTKICQSHRDAIFRYIFRAMRNARNPKL